MASTSTKKPYRPDEVEPIERTIKYFLEFLKTLNLMGIYKRKLEVKVLMARQVNTDCMYCSDGFCTALVTRDCTNCSFLTRDSARKKRQESV